MKTKIHIWELDQGGYHLTIQGKLMGQPVVLLIDTGANHSCFDRNFIAQLHKGNEVVTGRDEVNVGIGGSDFETLIAEVEQLKIGRLTFPKMEVRLLDLQAVNDMYTTVGFSEIHGILGSDLLMRYHAVIDFPNRQLILNKNRTRLH